MAGLLYAWDGYSFNLIPNSGHYFPLCPYTIIIYLLFWAKAEARGKGVETKSLLLKRHGSLSVFTVFRLLIFHKSNDFLRLGVNRRGVRHFQAFLLKKLLTGISFQRTAKTAEEH